MNRSNRDEFISGATYHFYNRSADRKTIFHSDVDFDYFLDRFIYYFGSIFDIYAFCLMKNHFHFIVKVKSEDDIREYADIQIGNSPTKYLDKTISLDQYLNDQLRRFFSSVSIKFNNRYNRRGQVFARSPKRVFIENTRRLRYLIAYTHHNPIHHGFNSEYSQWKYSSYQTLLSNTPTKLGRQDVMKLFGGIKEFNTYHDLFQLSKMEDDNPS